ncbi:MAG: ABC transporter permease [Limisphaerales bacterium]
MNEFRRALRFLARTPGYSILAVFTLGLGIGLVATQYSLIDGVLLRPLPFPEGNRVVHVARQTTGGDAGWRPFSVGEFLAHRDQQSGFEELAALQGGNQNLSRAGRPPRRMESLAVSANFFSILRTEAFLGSVFRPGDDKPGEPIRVILSHGFWEREFGGDRTVVGSPVRISGEPATIAGVMPPGFQFPGREDCWTNLRLDPRNFEGKVSGTVEVMGRLRPGVGLAQAEAELGVIQQRLDQSHPDRTTDPSRALSRVKVQPFQFAHTGPGTTTLLGTLQAMTVFVLGLACLNVANLLLARASGRSRDLAIRAALGAPRTGIFRLLLSESLLLAGAGALVGLVLAGIGVWLLQTQMTPRVDLSSWIRFDLNGRILGVTILTACMAGLAAGTWPALKASRVDPCDVLKDGSHGGTQAWQGRLGRWLATGQITMASALVIAAAILALSAVRSSRVTLGYDPASLLIGRVELLGPSYSEPGRRIAFFAQLEEKVSALPGVAGVAISSRDLVSPAVYSEFELESPSGTADSARQGRGAWLEVVSRGYFGVVNRGALAGRVFDSGDTSDGLTVAVVNQSFVRKFWPGADPIGRRIRRDDKDSKWATVVGVVPDLTMEGVGNRDPSPGWYLLQDQQAWGWMNLLVRTQSDPNALIPSLREAVADIDSEQPVHSISTLDQRTARQVAGLEVVGSMALVFAATALLLSGVGSYGVLAFGFRLRAREFGVRTALGATSRQLVRLLVRENAWISAAAILLGLGLGYAMAIPFAPFVPEVSATEPPIYLAVGITMALVAGLAILVPALRATRIDPATVLRSE